MYAETFQQLGLAKNEAKIYETLLKKGEISVSTIAAESGVHRRNVYDSLARLSEKGLVFEILESKENKYQAVDPDKLVELVEEKRKALNKIMPDLKEFHSATPQKDATYVYRGVEGWKNYMRDLLRLAESAYFLGAKGAWLDPRIKDFLPTFKKEAKRKNIKFYTLFDHEVQKTCPQIADVVGENHKFLPKEFSSPAGVDIFADRIYILSKQEVDAGKMEDDFTISVIINQNVADSFKAWFKYMWEACPSKRKVPKVIEIK